MIGDFEGLIGVFGKFECCVGWFWEDIFLFGRCIFEFLLLWMYLLVESWIVRFCVLVFS